jgi:tetratricopeptide (TPR) repeat protein
MSPQEPFPILPAVRQQLDRAGLEFLAGFYERECERHPRNLPALAELAHALTRLGRLEAGLQADLRLMRLVPDNPTVHYNLACSLTLLGRPDEALDALEIAIECGYDDAAHMAHDEDLRTLEHEFRFQRMLRRLEAEAADLSSR